MIVRFFVRCFKFCVLFVGLVVGTLVVCGILACSQPGFYATSVAQPVDEADDAAALQEMELIVDALELFVKQNPADLQKLKALAALPRPVLADGKRHVGNRLPTVLKALERGIGETDDTFAVTLTQRHLNAWLRKEFGTKAKELRRPHISLEDDMFRFAVTVVTPATEVVASCDLKLSKSNESGLIFELFAVRAGQLPVPAMTILKQYLRTDPDLPRDIELNVDGERPTLSVSALPDDGALQLENLHIDGGEVHLTLRRTVDAILAER